MIEITGKRNAARQSSKRPERQTDREARGLSPLGSSASARLLRLLRARLAALAGSALPGERPARWVASGARAGRLLSRRFPLNFPRSSTTQATTRRTSASGRRTRAWRGSRRRVGGRTPHSFLLSLAFFLSFPRRMQRSPTFATEPRVGKGRSRGLILTKVELHGLWH